MVKGIFLLSVLLLITQQAYSEETTNPVPPMPGQLIENKDIEVTPYTEGVDLKDVGLEIKVQEPQSIEFYNEGLQLESEDGLDPGQMCEFSNTACHAFVEPSCKLGVLGRRMVQLFDSTIENRSGRQFQIGHFIENPPSDISSVCPNYKSKMSHEQKKLFWVWMMMSLSHDESSCNQFGQEGKTVGAFQLEKSAEDRKNLRPKICHNESIRSRYPNQSIHDILPNLDCAVAMLSVQLAEPTRNAYESREDLKPLSIGKLFTQGSYWGKLVRGSPEFLEMMRDRRSGDIESEIEDWTRVRRWVSEFPFCGN